MSNVAQPVIESLQSQPLDRQRRVGELLVVDAGGKIL